MKTLLRTLFLSLIVSSMKLPFGYGEWITFRINDTTNLQETLQATKRCLMNKDTVTLSVLSKRFSMRISPDGNTINFTTYFVRNSEDDFCCKLITRIFKIFPHCQWNGWKMVMGRLVRSEDYVEMNNGNLTVKLPHLSQPMAMAMLPVIDKLLQDCTSFTWIEPVISQKAVKTTGRRSEGCNSGLTRKALISFVETLLKNDKIKKVDLSLNNISDETAIWLCNVLIQNSSIEKISLKSNAALRSEITESGYNNPWQEFIQALQGIEPGRSLDISLIGNRIVQEKTREFSTLKDSGIISPLVNLHLRSPEEKYIRPRISGFRERLSGRKAQEPALKRRRTIGRKVFQRQPRKAAQSSRKRCLNTIKYREGSQPDVRGRFRKTWQWRCLIFRVERI